MANNTEEKLFSQFPPVSTEQWEAAITADLKGADYQKKLVWRTTEGFNVRPYYRAEDLEGIKYLGKKSGEFPYVRGNRCNNRWRIHETIAVKDVAEANRLALHAVEAGADSIGFDLSEKLSAQQVADLMAGIDLNATELAFSGKPDAELPDKVLSVAEAKKADPEKFRVFFGFDPLIRQLSLTGAFCDGDDGQQCYKTIAGFVRGAKAWPKAKFVTVSGETFQNSGSTITQELAFTLAAGHEYLVKLTEAGLSAEEAGPTIRFLGGGLSDEEVRGYYLRAKAFLFPGEEDFGITPVEAQSAGTPVLAFGRGGACETVLDGKTGLLFDEQTPESLEACIQKFETEGVAYPPQQIREHSRSFSEQRFEDELRDYCTRRYADWQRELEACSHHETAKEAEE